MFNKKIDWIYKILFFICLSSLKSVDFSASTKEIIESIKTENKSISLLISRSLLYVSSKLSTYASLSTVAYTIVPENIVFHNYPKNLFLYMSKNLSSKEEQVVDCLFLFIKQELSITNQDENDILKFLLEFLYVFFEREKNFNTNDESLNKFIESLKILINQDKIEKLLSCIFNNNLNNMSKFCYHLHQIEKGQKNVEEMDSYLIIHSPHNEILLKDEWVQVLKHVKRIH